MTKKIDMDFQHYLARRPPDYADTNALGRCLRAMVEAGLDRLPLPGSGHTLERFQRLFRVLEGRLGGESDLLNRNLEIALLVE